MADPDTTSAFVAWFKDHNGVLDASSMQLSDIPGHGKGALAVRDIPDGHTLFEIPRDLTLSTRTSSLPERFGRTAWKKYGLDKGWVGLILCMIWEESLGNTSKWSGYLNILPSTFVTPMFWTDDDLNELKGTAVVDKIGREDAERDYNEKLVPAIQSRPDLFPPSTHSTCFSVERYHIMGSRILSRSFHVEPWANEDLEEDHDHGEEDGSDDQENLEANVSQSSAMDVDEPSENAKPSQEQTQKMDEDSEDEEDIDNPADIAMVPMADMLNARFESENAKLFYEENILRMVTTKPIKRGEQIWNTYGDPPNSYLLRRYGHVDVVPLRPPLKGEGNPADVVEIRADLVVAAASHRSKGDMQERVDWWLELADDDTFVVETDCEVPKELISLIHLLLLSRADWQKLQAKEKLPKAKLTSDIIPIAIEVFRKRLEEYSTSLEEDERLLEDPALSLNKRNAVIVRLGEKRILKCTLERLQSLKTTVAGGNTNKRKDMQPSEKSGQGKKARR